MIQLCINVPWARESPVHYVAFIMGFPCMLGALKLSTTHDLTFITSSPITKSPGIRNACNNTTCFVWANMASPSKFSDYRHSSYQVGLTHSCLPAILGPQESCLPGPPVSTSPLSPFGKGVD